jgi:hypothetical protein
MVIDFEMPCSQTIAKIISPLENFLPRNHVACSLGAIHSVQTMTEANEMKL